MLKKLIKILGLILLSLICLVAVFKYYPYPKTKIPELSDLSDLDRFVEQVVIENGLPSLSVVLLDSTGVKQHSFFGVRKKGGNTKVTELDQYHLGSNTKAFTSVLAAMMIDDGMITWETTLIDVFPELSDQIHADYHDVSLHDLLTHRSGIQANFGKLDAAEDSNIQDLRLKIIVKNLQDPAKTKKGEFLYSNLGYVTAGSMLEKISNQSWESLMKERLFVPLQMASAGFGIPGTKGKEDQPWGHLKLSGLLDFIPLQEDNPEAIGPAGTIHCSMEDWSKFISFQLMSQDTSLLSVAQRIKLRRPVKSKYACGWTVFKPTWSDDLVYTHAGSNKFNFSESWIIPKENKGILINSNSNYKNIRDLFRQVRDKILEVQLTQKESLLQ